jgi:hypothetical protein
MHRALAPAQRQHNNHASPSPKFSQSIVLIGKGCPHLGFAVASHLETCGPCAANCLARYPWLCLNAPLHVGHIAPLHVMSRETSMLFVAFVLQARLQYC